MWFEEAREAEQAGDWEKAVALVRARAECYSADHTAHDAHLWHMSLLVRAERFAELTALASTDVHARRALNRSLHEREMDGALRDRAECGDRDALYRLVGMLCETGRGEEACRVVDVLGPEDAYALRLVAGSRGPSR
ncbi:hypothetical protein [Streptomyces sp. NPDC013457]|uniref:hypothetical protein n=1 Tax=Streptomyces sp. NPDC013457 TaxID=3364866 RepID=UPI0036F87F01